MTMLFYCNQIALPEQLAAVALTRSGHCRIFGTASRLKFANKASVDPGFKIPAPAGMQCQTFVLKQGFPVASVYQFQEILLRLVRY